MKDPKALTGHWDRLGRSKPTRRLPSHVHVAAITMIVNGLYLRTTQ